MLTHNRSIRRKFTVLARCAVLLLPVLCIVLLLTQVAFAKNTYLINDGGNVVIHTTFATDPEAVLDEAGLTLGAEDTYTTQASIGISEITIQRRQEITVIYSNHSCTAVSYGETVEELLERMNIAVDADDILSVSLSAETYDGMTIVISKTVSVEEVYTAVIPYETEYCYDASLSAGEQVVLTEGCNGQIQYTDTVLYVDGCEISRTTSRQSVLCDPVTELIAIGTEVALPDYPQATEPEETVPATTQPTETAPEETTPETTVPETEPATEPETEPATEPETETATTTVPDTAAITGELVIGDGYIVTEDGDVLTYTDTMQVVATAYHNSDAGCNAYTATGTLARVGAIAVDPSVIPYGTRMFIVTNDGAYIYGIAVAEDCGGAIDGNRVDLYFDTVAECWAFGIREATIYFLG